MNKQVMISILTTASLIAIQSCATNPEQAEAPASEQSPAEVAASPATSETGTLAIRANGEDFVRQGFVSKDGWQISFDHLYVNLEDITAYQTDPPFDPEAKVALQPKQQVSLEGVKTIDLAEGDENAEPILVGEVEAPSGRYNALSWKMVQASAGPSQGYPMLIQGTATKDGQTIDFTLKMEKEIAFTCGDFVGDQRKGILAAGETADLEATFHFDHLFGDAETPSEDDLNQGALGFEPLAAIAQTGQLDADLATLKENLSEEDYNKLLGVIPSLGHVGEGHCEETPIS